MQKLLSVACLAILVAFALALPGLCDVKSDFLASNPNNGWEYGFISEEGSFMAYNTTFDDGQGIAGWCLDNTPGPMGDVTINYSAFPIDRYGVHWEPGQIVVHSSSPTTSVVIRWHAPGDATVRVEATLTAQSPNASAGVTLNAGGRELAQGQLGAVSESGQNMAMSASSDTGLASEPSEEISSSVTTSINTGGTLDLVITPGIDQAPSHIGAVLFITPTGAGQTSLSKASLGKKLPEKQARLLNEDIWLGPLAFDAVLRRG